MQQEVEEQPNEDESMLLMPPLEKPQIKIYNRSQNAQMLLSNPESDQSSIFSHERSAWPANNSIMVGSFVMGSQLRSDDQNGVAQSQQVMMSDAHGSRMQYPYGKDKASISMMAVNAPNGNQLEPRVFDKRRLLFSKADMS